MRWTCKEFMDLMTWNNPPREMFCETMGLLLGLDREWISQGATPEELNLTAFGFDYLHTAHVGNTGAIHGQQEIVLEDNAEYLLKRDGWGRIVKLMKAAATIPLPISYPVKTMDDWLKLKPMFLYSDERIDMVTIDKAKELQANGSMIKASIYGGFNLPRELMGEENACLCYYEDPELMHDILNTVSEMNFEVLDKVSRQIQIDSLTIHEDMAGRNGPLIGPSHILEFIRPYYRRTIDMLQAKGSTPLVAQDSDGDMSPVIEAFMECGVNLFYPCEPTGNMDIVALRKQYGRKICLLGGIDKHVIRQSKEAIRKELEYKLQSCMRGGGICFGLDHRIPNGTPLDHYRYYVKTVQEILDIDASEKGWLRFF